MLARLATAAALALALAACAQSTLPDEGPVRAAAAGDFVLRITNEGSRPVHVRVVGRQILAQWAPCTPGTCPAIQPGQTLRVPYVVIEGYTPGEPDADVRWWVFEGAGDAYRTADQGSLVAKL